MPTLLGLSDGSSNVLVGGPTGRADLRVQGADADSFASDLLGTLVSTPATDDLVADDTYDAYGTPAAATGPAPTLGFRGEVLAGGLVHLRARDLDPATGQFTTRDPLDGVAGTTTVVNPYHYGDNDPVNRADPLGLYAIDDGQFDDGDLIIPMGLIDGAPCLPPVDSSGNLLVYSTADGTCGSWSGGCDGAIVPWFCENSDVLVSIIASGAIGLICGAAAAPAGPAAAGAAAGVCGGAVFRGLMAYADGEDPWSAAFDLRAMLFDAALGAGIGAGASKAGP
ncbi:MAG TPA: RHS repeat-associated core domain-containing protein [Iamia sp.]